jgi:hypothetical protein
VASMVASAVKAELGSRREIHRFGLSAPSPQERTTENADFRTEELPPAWLGDNRLLSEEGSSLRQESRVAKDRL